jgi:hypothetical protein
LGKAPFGEWAVETVKMIVDFAELDLKSNK